MNKSKTILASVGGATLVASLGLAYFIWSAMSEKGERLEELEGAEQSVAKIMRLPVNPGPESIKACEENAEAYDSWRAEAQKVVTMGDKFFEPTTPPALKSFLVEDARRLSYLPGGVDGLIVKPEFPFGFREYVLDGRLPAQEDLARLQREWYDMSVVVETLSKCGVSEITDLTVMAAAPAQTEAPKEGKRQGQKKGAKKSAKQEATPEDAGPDVTRMRLEFRATPPAFVAVVNTLLMSRRFVVIDDFSFARERDEISERLGGDAKKVDEPQSGRRGRRGRRSQQEDESDEQTPDASAMTGVVTDPQTAPALKVVMSISVYDFRTAKAAPVEAPSADVAPEEAAPADEAGAEKMEDQQ